MDMEAAAVGFCLSIACHKRSKLRSNTVYKLLAWRGDEFTLESECGQLYSLIGQFLIRCCGHNC